MLDRGAGKDQRVAAQDVVDVGALLRQQVDLRNVARGPDEVRVELRPVDDEDRLPAELLEALGERLRLRLGGAGRIENDELALGGLRRERAFETELANLLLQIERVAAHDGAEDDRARPELWRAQRAMPRAPRPLLTVRLLRRAGDLAHALRLVRAGAALRELPIDDTRQDVLADRDGEDLVGELDLSDRLVVEIADLGLHLTPPRPARPPLQHRGSPPGTARPSAPCASPRP